MNHSVRSMLVSVELLFKASLIASRGRATLRQH